MDEEEKSRVKERFEDATLQALKTEEENMNHELQMACKSWKRQGKEFSKDSKKENSPAETLIFNPVKPISDF